LGRKVLTGQDSGITEETSLRRLAGRSEEGGAVMKAIKMGLVVE